MYVMKYAVPYMLEQKSGAIVVIASAGSYTPAATMSTYCSSKYAVAGLTKCVANKVGPSGVHVNFICPGPVATDMMLRIERDTFGPDMPHEEAEKLMRPPPSTSATASPRRLPTPRSTLRPRYLSTRPACLYISTPSSWAKRHLTADAGRQRPPVDGWQLTADAGDRAYSHATPPGLPGRRFFSPP